MLRSLFALSLLTLALLTAQLGAVTHGIAHALGEQSRNSSQALPDDKHCDRCAAYAQIGGAVGSSTIHLIVGANLAAEHLHHAHRSHSPSFAAFAARAPPRLA